MRLAPRCAGWSHSMSGEKGGKGVLPVGRDEAIAFCRDGYVGHGKLEILPKVTVRELRDIAVAFTPGVGHAVKEIQARPEALGELTNRDNTIAIVTDGTAVLGYGNAGPRAAMPVMEGKSAMFKMLAGIDCVPLCVEGRDGAYLVELMQALEPSFGGYNLEDVASPVCFEVMRRVESEVSVPVLHDDQYGTATVIIAALANALKVTGRPADQQRVVVNGAGAAGTATVRMLSAFGVGDIVVNDRDGILCRGRAHRHAHWDEIARTTNVEGRQGDLSAALRGADVFIGLSVANLVTQDMIRSMARSPIVLALANPDPEILPEAALAAGAAIAASGRFDYPNHCNNVLAFPSLMRGALDCKARRISIDMCLAAAAAIAGAAPDATLSPSCILPSPLDPELYPSVAEATAQAAVRENLARVIPARGAVAAHTRELCAMLHLRQKSIPSLAREGTRVA